MNLTSKDEVTIEARKCRLWNLERRRGLISLSTSDLSQMLFSGQMLPATVFTRRIDLAEQAIKLREDLGGLHFFSCILSNKNIIDRPSTFTNDQSKHHFEMCFSSSVNQTLVNVIVPSCSVFVNDTKGPFK